MRSIARWPIPGQSTTIEGTRHAYWRETYEKEKLDGEQTVLASCRTRTPKSRQGRAQDCPDAWYADLRVGKWQGRGEETVKTEVFRQLGLGGRIVALDRSHRILDQRANGRQITPSRCRALALAGGFACRFQLGE